MTNSWKAKWLAAALMLAPMPVVLALPAQAQAVVTVDFDTFHHDLAGYGSWAYSDRWGEVWVPADVRVGWRPYAFGHWVYVADYGWTWVSSEGPWADVVYHYGRWVDDPDSGWIWVPGYVWGPGWVVWRSSGPYVGWMPMPPDAAFFNATFAADDWDDLGGYYGYSGWYGSGFGDAEFGNMWTFVPVAHLGDVDYRQWALPEARAIAFMRNSHNVTNFAVSNHFVTNRSISADAVQRASGHPVSAMSPGNAFRRPDLVTRADQGRQMQQRMAQVAPHGTGRAGSAPTPSQSVVRSLSPRLSTHGGTASAHLLDRTTAERDARQGSVTHAEAGAAATGHAARLGAEQVTRFGANTATRGARVRSAPSLAYGRAGYAPRSERTTGETRVRSETRFGFTHAPSLSRPMRSQSFAHMRAPSGFSRPAFTQRIGGGGGGPRFSGGGAPHFAGGGGQPRVAPGGGGGHGGGGGGHKGH